MGRDQRNNNRNHHYPIETKIGIGFEKGDMDRSQRWSFKKADWEKFKYITNKEMQAIHGSRSVDELNESVCKTIVEAANHTIKKKEGKKKMRIVPWWSDECDKVIKERNKAFKKLKKNP